MAQDVLAPRIIIQMANELICTCQLWIPYGCVTFHDDPVIGISSLAEPQVRRLWAASLARLGVTAAPRNMRVALSEAPRAVAVSATAAHAATTARQRGRVGTGVGIRVRKPCKAKSFQHVFQNILRKLP